MKSNNSTLHPCGISYLPTTRKRFSSFLTTVALLVSSVTFAGSPSGIETMRVNLYLLMQNNTTILADGVLTEYNNLYHDSVTLEDAYKFTNINENLGLVRHGHTLAVERRPIITTIDTLYLKLWKTSKRSYQFEFVTTNLDHPGMQGFLEDSYLGTSQPLSLSGTTKLNFLVNSDAESAAINRFRIVYRESYNGSPLPVNFASIRAYMVSNKISIDWKVENELNIDRYEVEKSTNGIDFVKMSSVASAKLNGSSTYSSMDETPATGNNFYRVKSIDRDGSKKLSPVVKMSNNKNTDRNIAIYPNPIRGNTINLRFTNQPAGIYQVRLFNNSGQVVYTGRLSINSNNITQTIYTGKKLTAGIYQLETKAPDNTANVQQAIVQD